MKKVIVSLLFMSASLSFGVGSVMPKKPAVKTEKVDTAERIEQLEFELSVCTIKALNPATSSTEKMALDKKCKELEEQIDVLKGGVKKRWALIRKVTAVTGLVGLVATGLYAYMNYGNPITGEMPSLPNIFKAKETVVAPEGSEDAPKVTNKVDAKNPTDDARNVDNADADNTTDNPNVVKKTLEQVAEGQPAGQEAEKVNQSVTDTQAKGAIVEAVVTEPVSLIDAAKAVGIGAAVVCVPIVAVCMAKMLASLLQFSSQTIDVSGLRFPS